jgi:hypothetical protein
MHVSWAVIPLILPGRLAQLPVRVRLRHWRAWSVTSAAGYRPVRCLAGRCHTRPVQVMLKISHCCTQSYWHVLLPWKQKSVLKVILHFYSVFAQSSQCWCIHICESPPFSLCLCVCLSIYTLYLENCRRAFSKIWCLMYTQELSSEFNFCSYRFSYLKRISSL